MSAGKSDRSILAKDGDSGTGNSTKARTYAIAESSAVMMMGAGMVIETVDAIIAGTVKPIPQSEMLTAGEKPTPAPKIFKDTCRIDWNWCAEKVYNHVRGLSPYPAAWAEIVDAAGKVYAVKIFETSEPEAPSANLVPGTLTTDGKRLWVACADAKIEILSLQMAGKRRMPTADFLRGFNIEGCHC